MTHLTVQLNGGLSLELVSRQVRVVRGLDVVVGQRIVQLLLVHLGFLVTGRKVLLVHQVSGEDREPDELRLQYVRLLKP